MLNIFGGPFHDQTTRDAFGALQDTPHLIVDVDEYQKGYADRFIQILAHSGGNVWRVNPLNRDRINVSDMLFHHDFCRTAPKSDWTNSPPKRRIPYFSGFRIGGGQ